MDNDPIDVTAYLRRINYTDATIPTVDTLRALQLHHVAAIAFETLSPMLHDPVPLDLPALQRKVLHGGRGGYCYELNLLFMQLLRALGFDAKGLTGRVVMGGPEDAETPRTHMLLLVTIAGTRYIADVGFGGMTPSGPLLLDSEDVQATPHDPYRVTRVDGRYTLRAQVRGEWRALYVFDLVPPMDVDYEVGNWYVATHPDSPFRGQLVAARVESQARHTLHNGDYAIHRLGAASERRHLDSPDEVIELLGTVFKLRVPEDPRLRATLERLIAQP
ncbi:arylamine N-acetyltransferase family protein [Lysobacter sp. A421]